MNENLHHLDLAQMEKIRKLHVRLTSDLQTYDRYTQAIALRENQENLERLKLSAPSDPSVPTVEKLEEEQVQVVVALKSSIWSCAQALKKLHDKRDVLRASLTEQAEMEPREA